MLKFNSSPVLLGSAYASSLGHPSGLFLSDHRETEIHEMQTHEPIIGAMSISMPYYPWQKDLGAVCKQAACKPLSK